MSATASLLFLFTAGNLAAITSDDRLNLPQVKLTVRIKDAARSALRDYFFRPRAGAEFPLALQNSIIQQIPASFDETCTRIVRQWGAASPSDAKFLRVRILSHEDARVWLAFRCGIPGAERGPLFDERLALLHLHGFAIDLLPLGPDSDDEVYHIEFLRPLKIKNAAAFLFHLAKLQNPCCEGPESRSQERLVILADTPRGPVESLSVETARDDLSHCDDPEIDTETTKHSEVRFERDAGGFETTIFVTFHEKVIDTHWESGVARPQTVSDQSGTLRYRWNPITFAFEQIH